MSRILLASSACEMCKCVQGAEVIHNAGLIHGDLNPTNCMVDVDFGVSDVKVHTVVVDLGSCKEQTAREALLLALHAVLQAHSATSPSSVPVLLLLYAAFMPSSIASKGCSLLSEQPALLHSDAVCMYVKS